MANIKMANALVEAIGKFEFNVSNNKVVMSQETAQVLCISVVDSLVEIVKDTDASVDFYTGPALSPHQVDKLRKNFNIPQSEEVLAFIEDSFFFGKKGVAFCSKGVYFHKCKGLGTVHKSYCEVVDMTDSLELSELSVNCKVFFIHLKSSNDRLIEIWKSAHSDVTS